jgi:hypothetical protein
MHHCSSERVEIRSQIPDCVSDTLVLAQRQWRGGQASAKLNFWATIATMTSERKQSGRISEWGNLEAAMNKTSEVSLQAVIDERLRLIREREIAHGVVQGTYHNFWWLRLTKTAAQSNDGR